jgi:deazaflavin-dependent oxidoreductase (nitroreductase family)
LENLIMDDAITHALEHDLTIEITTTGRKTGQPRRIEIWFHNLDGDLYLTGLPRPCSWYANLCAHPDFTFHLKESAQADLVARATPVLAPAMRRDIIARIQQKLGRTGKDLEDRVASSPLLKIELTSG